MSQHHLRHLDELAPALRVCIYGAGGRGTLVYEMLKNHRPDVHIQFFVDDYKTNYHEGLEIVSYSGMMQRQHEYDVILIASLHVEAILSHLECDNYYIVSTDQFSYDTTQVFTVEEKQKYQSLLTEVKKLIPSESEKKLWDALIEARSIEKTQTDYFDVIIQNHQRLLNSKQSQYLEHLRRQPVRTIIDGGFFDGFTALHFVEACPHLEKIYGFEPFREAYINSPHWACLEKTQKIQIEPSVLWKQEGELTFLLDLTQYSASRLQTSINSVTTSDHQLEQVRVPAVSIDSFVEKNNISSIDLIKLDVEGAETDVLLGAINTIQKYRPQLAISIYHKKEDMFTIPLWLHSILKNYTYHLGHYSLEIYETVWYCIPNEQY